MDSEDHQRSASDRSTVEFLRLLSQHERRVKSFILALVPNWADADDLYQETTVRLWEQFADYDPDQEFGAWACTIAYYIRVSDDMGQWVEIRKGIKDRGLRD